jgi:hypothetical protein
MSDNNQPDKRIEKKKENKDDEDSEESEESEENENEEEVVEKEKIDFHIPLRDKEDYSLHPRKPKLEPTRKLYGDEWRYPVSLFTEPSTEPYDPTDHSDFELDNDIEIFKFEKLTKVKPYQVIKEEKE